MLLASEYCLALYWNVTPRLYWINWLFISITSKEHCILPAYSLWLLLLKGWEVRSWYFVHHVTLLELRVNMILFRIHVLCYVTSVTIGKACLLYRCWLRSSSRKLSSKCWRLNLDIAYSKCRTFTWGGLCLKKTLNAVRKLLKQVLQEV